MTRAAGLFVVWCACSTQTPIHAPAAEPGCDLGPPITPFAPQAVASYPVVLHLDEVALAERTRVLAAKVSGWTLVLDRDGFPHQAIYELATPVQRKDVPEHDALVTALFTTLRDDYGFGPKFRVIPLGNGNMQVATDTPREGHYVAANVIQDEAPGGARLTVTAYRVIPKPPALIEITTDELLQHWGTSGTREVAISRDEPGNNCDPVTPSGNECAGTGPRTVVECRPLVGDARHPGALIHDIIDTADGYRWVIALRIYNCNAPFCRFKTSIPVCTDAITGEVLAPSLCGPAEL